MAWTAPLTAATGTLTAAQWNSNIRDNLNETEVGKASTVGGYFVSTAANAIAQRTISSSSVSTSSTTTGTTYANIASFGPSVTVTTGTSAMGWYAVESYNSTLDAYCAASVEVSGASSISASDVWAIEFDGYGVGAASQQNVRSVCQLFTGLTAGSNTFTMKYRVDSGTGTFANRRLIIMPF